MKYVVTSFLTLVLIVHSVSSPGYGKGKTTKETIVSGNTKRDYFLFVPESQSAAKPLPLLILLHGSNRDGMSLIEKWKDIAERKKYN